MNKWKGGPDTKPNWDNFYMTLALTIAQRSVDENTVHGACLVSSDHRLLSIGYNGPLRNCEFEQKDLIERPSKYFLMIHAEENCLINYHGSFSDLNNATIYITGEPCHRCLRMILQKGIRRIVHGPVNSKCVDDDDRKAKEKMIKCMTSPPKIIKHSDSASVKRLLNKTLLYIEHKENE